MCTKFWFWTLKDREHLEDLWRTALEFILNKLDGTMWIACFCLRPRTVAGCCLHVMTSYVLASQEGLRCMELARCAWNAGTVWKILFSMSGPSFLIVMSFRKRTVWLEFTWFVVTVFWKCNWILQRYSPLEVGRVIATGYWLDAPGIESR